MKRKNGQQLNDSISSRNKFERNSQSEFLSARKRLAGDSWRTQSEQAQSAKVHARLMIRRRAKVKSFISRLTAEKSENSFKCASTCGRLCDWPVPLDYSIATHAIAINHRAPSEACAINSGRSSSAAVRAAACADWMFWFVLIAVRVKRACNSEIWSWKLKSSLLVSILYFASALCSIHSRNCPFSRLLFAFHNKAKLDLLKWLHSLGERNNRGNAQFLLTSYTAFLHKENNKTKTIRRSSPLYRF